MNIRELLNDVIKETGLSLDVATDELALYVVERSTHLATLVGQPGFELALQAERDNVALYAGVSVSLQASAADARLVGVIQAALLGDIL